MRLSRIAIEPNREFEIKVFLLERESGSICLFEQSSREGLSFEHTPAQLDIFRMFDEAF